MRAYFFGCAALLLISTVFPMERGQPPGPVWNAALPLTALICGAWILQLLVFRRRSDFEPSRAVIAAVALVVIALLSFAAGQYPWFHSSGAPLPAQTVGLALLVLSAGLFLAVGHQIRQIRYLRWLTWLFLVAAGFFCLTQVLPLPREMARMTAPASAGSMYWIWLAAIASSQALFNRDLPKTVRFALFGLAGLGLFRGLALAASWASGWLPPLVAIAVIFLFRVPRTVVGLGLVALPGIFYMAGRAQDPLLAQEQYSWMTRLEAWRVLWRLFENNPLIGLGPANYYHYTKLYPILGWYVSFSSHNNYVDLLLQTGILGLLAFGWIVLEVLRIVFRLLRAESLDGFSRAYLIGALGGLSGALVAGMLADWIIPFFYNIGVRGFRSSLLFWFFLGGVLALKRIAAYQSSARFQEPREA